MNFYLWSFLVTLVIIIFFHFWIRSWELKEFKYLYLYLFLCLPLSLLVNQAIKRPLGLLLLSSLNLGGDPKNWPLWFLPIANLIAPFTEEGIKLLPIIFSEVRKSLNEKKMALILGLIFGAGFGIGEVWYLAILFTQQMPNLATASFLPLIGFFSERVLAVIAHGCMTAIILMGFKRNLLKYYLIGVAFHYFINFGAVLYQSGRASLDVSYIPILVMLFLLVSYIFRIERQLHTLEDTPTKGSILYKKGE